MIAYESAVPGEWVLAWIVQVDAVVIMRLVRLTVRLTRADRPRMPGTARICARTGPFAALSVRPAAARRLLIAFGPRPVVDHTAGQPVESLRAAPPLSPAAAAESFLVSGSGAPANIAPGCTPARIGQSAIAPWSRLLVPLRIFGLSCSVGLLTLPSI